MARSARHAAPHTPAARSAVLRAGLALTAAGVALGAGAGAAAADEPAANGSGGQPTSAGQVDVPAAGRVLTDSVGHAVGPVTELTLDPLAGTGVDPLDNGLGTQIADFKPVSTKAVTGLVTGGGSVSTLPVVGQAAGLLTR
ncbi:hypothetical protein [Streptomyces sp. NPDC058045]|uniref:hypothetical protein n=1 Tax=Streptomyces sp. NPDC058045 TaxID=3346311 RepID=UPI0036EDAE16